jgi:nucleoside 2-deoxyribosyltransferase
MKIYLAGPLFTQAEQEFNAMLARELRRRKHEVFLPQEEECQHGESKVIFRTDLHGLNMADCVVAVLDGSDVDSGTAWEVGYAYSQRKSIVGIRTDFRLTEGVNCMISESLDILYFTVDGLLEAFE